MGFLEFVTMIAGLMALNALALDIMLPALPEIGHGLGLTRDNDRQLVLSTYMVGFGLGQFVIGSVSDRFGRKPVLMFGIVVYIATAAICAMAPSFVLLLVARFMQGLASAVPRVITTSVVRDCYNGRRMASVMSLSMMVFMAVPVLAPSIGQIIVLVAPWRAIFGFLAIYGVIVGTWSFLRLPETLPADRRRPINPRSVFEAFVHVLGNRLTVGYSLAGGLMFGAMFSLLLSAQQIFGEVYGLGPWFPVAFAGIAIMMSLSSFLNARFVGRLGMKRISHTAVMAFTLIALTMSIAARAGVLSFPPFIGLLAMALFFVGLVFANFNAIAMEPQGKIAGTASSIIGSLTTLLAASIGSITGQAFDGTVIPLSTAHLVLGLAALATISVTEKGRLFGP
ncbi:multidrug effflux MFS transporter [Alsobacter sp. SYSU M60028]|uniref:Bcr/CflA family efflux transporter n=1 Tax=Alsobacter ponti TaxID=2962936 RepID=A0ABT1LF20_9HYPH|nr:multidrug effflux MFS transporter [Alsobacter ponti]MCP8939503.1 multidrug effflux MFS transporter [Alsobacter ponti]